MKNLTISQRIIAILIAVALLAVFVFAFLYGYKIRKEEVITQVAVGQFSHEVNSIFTLHSAALKQVVFDYTYWDEFVENTRPNNEPWFETNITTIISSFHFDYVAVYDSSGHLVHEASGHGYTLSSLLPASALEIIRKDRFADFSLSTDDGIVAVSAATIHGTNDPFHTRTPVSGYMVIGKLMDDKMLTEISGMLGAEITMLSTDAEIAPAAPYTLQITRDLVDYRGNVVARLLVSRSFPVSELYDSLAMYSLGILFVLILLALLVFYVTARRWVSRPLSLVSTILKEEDPNALAALQESSDEFRRLGVLFEDYIHQKEELVKARERAEESDRLKSAFLANISHEIRTPMNGVLGFTELLRDDTLDAESRNEYLGIVETSGKNLLSLINDIIDISKIEAGLMNIQPVDCNLNKVFRETGMLFNSNEKIRNQSIDLRLKLQFSDEAAWVRLDPSRLAQILTNLVGNAVKFTPKGFVEFGYRLSTDNQLLIFCRDTGIGIPKENHQSIFDRFVQVNNNSSRPYEGTGLGLAISSSLAALMDGRMWVESEPGKGSVFFMALPFVPVDRGFSPIFGDRERVDIPDLAGRLILIAEDVVVNYQFLKATLEKTGAEVFWAKNGKVAVEMAMNDPAPDLILMDLKMPEMNGYEATRMIKQRRPFIPIVAQTAYSLDGDRQKSIEAGCDEHLAKPIDTNELYAVLTLLLCKPGQES